MANIITVTFSPTIDKSTTIDALIPEKKLRCTEPKFEPGGGGINVARAIKKLGGDALAIYPAGGHTGYFLNDLMQAEGVAIETFPIKNYTRENMIVVETNTNQQYRFGMPGPALSEAEWQECLRRIEQHKEVEYIVASGSLPAGVPLDIYARIAAIAKKIDARLIIDTSGDALKMAVEEGLYLLKPNLSELSSLVDREEIQAECVDDVAMEIINKGKCEAVVVSMGQGGAMLVTRNEALLVSSPVVRKRSTVGAGDSMVGGMVLSLSRGWSMKDAVQYGVASGTAATMNPGTELCRLADVEKLYKVIKKMAPKRVVNG